LRSHPYTPLKLNIANIALVPEVTTTKKESVVSQPPFFRGKLAVKLWEGMVSLSNVSRILHLEDHPS